MTLIKLIFLSIALGMDCLVVSFSQGLCAEKRHANLLALIMGGFQGGMPVITYFLTGFVYSFLAPFSKIIVFGIFMFLGLKFILEALKNEKPEMLEHNYKTFILLGIATSIDAFGAGISLKLTNSSLILASLIIALGSYFMSQIGFWSGCRCKCTNTKYLEILAGLILILLAVNSLF